MTAEELLSRFESIGDTCEFAYVQRKAGYEGLSLLRWFSLSVERLAKGDDLSALRMLVEGFGTKFRALDTPANIVIKEPIRSMTIEFGVYVPTYDMSGHSGRYENEIDLPSVEQMYRAAMPIMRDVLFATLQEGAKILVYRSVSRHDLREMKELVRVLRSFGDNIVLWVTDGNGSPTAPTWVDDYLMHASLNKLTGYGRAPDVVHDEPHYQSWLRICREADAMVAARRG